MRHTAAGPDRPPRRPHIAAAALLMVGIAMLAKMANLPMGFDPGSVLQTGVLLLAIAIGSGALTLGALKKGEPADLLK